MKHKLSPVPGAARCVPVRVRTISLAGRAALAGLLLAASSLASAQVFVSVEASDDTASESPPDNGQFIIRQIGGLPLRPAIRIDYTVEGSASPGDDYAPLAGSVTLTFGQPQASVDVNVAGDDGVFEGDEETVIIRLGGDDDDDDDDDDDGDIIFVTDTATVTILDSAYSVTAASGANAIENGAFGEIIASLGARNESGNPLAVEYSIAGTATPDTDYEALSGSAVIPVGSTSASIEVRPLDDNLLESDETVDVTLTAVGDPRVSIGSPAAASLSIADDDADGDDDGDGLPNGDECPDFNQCRDTDQDAVPDYQDPDDDNDGVPTTAEGPPAQDTDNNGTPDYLDGDDDGDGRLTRDEDANQDGDGNPSTAPTDVDGDGVADYLDPDDGGGPQGDADGDGLTNEREEEIGTDPQVADTDADGVNDGDEDAAGTDPLDRESFADADGDLVPDAVEEADGTDPNDPASFADGDSGGTADHIETVSYASFDVPPTNPSDGRDDARDFDGDGLPDRLEIAIGGAPDSSDSPTANGAAGAGNGVTNAVDAYLTGLGIVPVDAASDFDRDAYPDAREVGLGLSPLSASASDSDGDGVPNLIELVAGADIDAASDADADGVPDAREIALDADPLDANSPVANGATDGDGDGVSNAIEHVLEQLGAANDADNASDGDGDGVGDADEIRLGTDPLRDEQPVPWIELAQADFGPVRALSTEGGAATATALVGGHQSGLTYDWSETDNAVLAVSSGTQTGRTLTFAPATLPPGLYNLVLRVERSIAAFNSPVSVVEFTVDVLANANEAALADADNDGVPDSSDNSDARQGFANTLPAQSIGPIRAPAGVRLQLGATARITQSGSALVTREDIAEAGGDSADAFDYLGGIYDFEVTNLPEAGSVVQIVMPQAGPIAESPEYRKFLPGAGWSTFTENENNRVESAAGSNNECPPPGDESYQAGLTPGHLCVQLSIEDGGPNDGDAGAGPNGVIKDPGGVATPEGQVVVGQGSGGTGPGALLALGILAGWFAYRRRAAAVTAMGLCVCCLVALPQGARADGFIGAGAGLSNLDPDTAGTPFSVSDKQDYGYKVFGGFDLTPISPNLSVEVFWADLGQATLDENDVIDYSVYGAGMLYGIGSVTAPRLSGTIEAGLARLDIGGDVPFQQEEETSLFMSIAGSFAIRRHLFLQLEYEYFAEDAQFLSLSIVKRFRAPGSPDVKTTPLPEQ